MFHLIQYLSVSGCFTRSPQVTYFKAVVGINVWRRPRSSVSNIHVHTTLWKWQMSVSQQVEDLQPVIIKYCILGWFTSQFNLEIGLTSSTHAHTFTVGDELRIIIHLVETSPPAPSVCILLWCSGTHTPYKSLLVSNISKAVTLTACLETY